MIEIFQCFHCICNCVFIELLARIFRDNWSGRELRGRKPRPRAAACAHALNGTSQAHNNLLYMSVFLLLMYCILLLVLRARAQWDVPHNNSKWHTLTGAPFRGLTSEPFETCGTNYVVKKETFKEAQNCRFHAPRQDCSLQCILLMHWVYSKYVSIYTKYIIIFHWKIFSNLFQIYNDISLLCAPNIFLWCTEYNPNIFQCVPNI